MKLESFKFQDGKVLWLPEYPEKNYDTWKTRLHNKLIAQSLASAIEVAPEAVGRVKNNIFMQNPEVRGGLSTSRIWHPEKDKVYSVECEMEVEKKKQQHLCKACKVDCIAALGKGTCKAPLIKVARLKPMKEHLPKPNESNRDWPEDYSQENGNYQNKCCLCGLLFYGNKHRVVCKMCTSFEE